MSEQKSKWTWKFELTKKEIEWLMAAVNINAPIHTESTEDFYLTPRERKQRDLDMKNKLLAVLDFGKSKLSEIRDLDDRFGISLSKEFQDEVKLKRKIKENDEHKD